jgi:hypothetical protein
MPDMTGKYAESRIRAFTAAGYCSRANTFDVESAARCPKFGGGEGLRTICGSPSITSSTP